jgi:GNAT superfamily N-acetyltransferase
MSMKQTSRVTIRSAETRDAGVLLDMIKGLAEYERLAHKLTTTVDDLKQCLLCEGAVAHTLIAEVDGQAVGYAVFFPTFSTFRGRPKMYLEDIFVRPSHRGLGVGDVLMRRVAGLAKERGCYRLEWSVLDWNEPAICFYRSLGASPADKEWTIFGVSDDVLNRLAAE